MKRKTGSSLWSLHNTGYDGGCIESTSCGWEDPTHKFASELQNLFKVMGWVIVKSAPLFTAS